MAPSSRLLTQAIVALRTAYPLLSLDVTLDTSALLFELLREGVLDVAIGRIRGEQWTDYVVTPLENEEFVIVVRLQHPLAKKKSVKFASLLDCPWLLQPTGSPMREVLEQEFRMQQAHFPRGLIETASILTTTNLIAETDMVGALRVAVSHPAQDGIVWLNYSQGQAADIGDLVFFQRFSSVDLSCSFIDSCLRP